MFDFLDVLAVREAVERQTPVRRRICRLLMRDWTKLEVAAKLGWSPPAVTYQIGEIRKSFRAMGFSEADVPRREKKKSVLKFGGGIVV